MKSLVLWGAFEQPLHDCLLEELRGAGSDSQEFELEVVSPSSSINEAEPATPHGMPAFNAGSLEAAEAQFNENELRALRGADIVLYQLRRCGREDFADILRVLKGAPEGKETTFIAVSNILTWARLRVVLDEPCTIADEPRRRPHPQYGDLMEAERRIIRAQKQGLLRTYVIWPGVQYGGGEGALESIFQDSWSGDGPTIYGFGDNVLPTVHVSDLASFIRQVALTLPQQQHLLAVDDGRCTQQALVEGVAAHFGTEVRRMSLEEMWLSNKRVEPSLLLNLPLQATPLEDMTWRYKEGPLPHIAGLARDFLGRRGLAPLRVSLHGPPAAGKSALARALAEEYGVGVLTLPAVIKWALEECEDPVLKQSITTALAPPPPVPEAKPKKGQPVAPSPEPKKAPRLSDALLAQAVRSYLMSGTRGPDSRRNGFILDGFPKTLEQSQLLFADEAVRSEAIQTPEPPPTEPETSRPFTKRVSLVKSNEDKADVAAKAGRKPANRVSPLVRMTSSNERQSPIPPEPAQNPADGTSGAPAKEQQKLGLDWLVLLKASDEILAARIAAIPEADKTGTHNIGLEFARRMSVYNEMILPEMGGFLESVRGAGASVVEIDQAELPERPSTEHSVAVERNNRSAGSDRPIHSAGSERNTVSAGSVGFMGRERTVGSAGSDRNIGTPGSDRNTRPAGSAGSLGDGLTGTMQGDEAEASDEHRETEAESNPWDSPRAAKKPGVTSAGGGVTSAAAGGGDSLPGTRPGTGVSVSGKERAGGTSERAITENPAPKMEPTGMGLETVVAKVKAAIGSPERYAGSKRKQEAVERTEAEADQAAPHPEEKAVQEEGPEPIEQVADAPVESQEAESVQNSERGTFLPEPQPELSPQLRATLEQRSAGIQAWLASAVMPAVLQAMLHAARARSDDPAEAMAQHLLQIARIQEARERAAQS